MSYYFDDDAGDLRKQKEENQKLWDAIYRNAPHPVAENNESFGLPIGLGRGGTSGGTASENTKIKDYGEVSGTVTIDQSFKSHRMTLSGDITIAFDGTADAQHLRELLFVIIQKAGQSYAVTWPDSVKTTKSIKIKDSSESDIDNHLIGFTVDGGITYQISNVGERRIISGGAIIDGSISASKIDGFGQETLNEINKWLGENEGLKYFNDNFESVKSNLDTAYTWVSGASQNVKDIINDAAAEIETALGSTYSNMKDWYENAGANINSAIANALESGGAILEQIADSLSGYATQAWVNAQSFVSDIISEISTNASAVINAIRPSLDGIYQTISGLTNEINNAINEALESGSEIFNNIVSSVSATVSDIVDLVSANASDVADALRSSLDSVYVSASKFASKTSEWLNDSAQAGLKFFNDLSSSARNAITSVSDWYSGLSSSVRNAIDDAVNWYNGLSSSVRSGISSAVSWYDSASVNVKNIIKSAGTEIEQGLGSAYTNLKSWYDTINSKVRDALEDIGSSITSFIYGDDSASSQGGSNGDVDLKTYDLVNVDRIFFNSNDSLKTNSVYPQITGKSNTGIDKNMLLYVPLASNFRFFVSSSEIMKISNLGITCKEPLQADDNINAQKYINIQESVSSGFAPSGITNYAILFSRPNSAGKTELRVKFQSGSSQLIAVES